jgi:hypothetical protein
VVPDRFGRERHAAKDAAEDYAGVNLASDSTVAFSRGA